MTAPVDHSVAVPQLRTDRLVLRGPERSDFAAYEAFMLSDRSHLAQRNPRLAWHLFATEFVGWVIQGFGHWIIARPDGAPLGIVGFSHPAYYPEPEMGWALFEAGHEGQGFATEAARAARDWARSRLPSLVSYVGPGNQRSAAVAARLGGVVDTGAALPQGVARGEITIFRHWRPA